MHNGLLLNFPSLHRELVAYSDCKSIFFLNPGIIRENDDEANWFTPKNYPFNSQASKSVLSELMSLGSDQFGSMLELSSTNLFYNENSKKYQNTNELSSLENFSTTGELGISPKETLSSENDYLIAAQKLLLLLWQHEDNIINITHLHKTIKEKELSLHSIITFGQDEKTTDVQSNLLPDLVDSQTLPCSWQRIFFSILPFLPQDPWLITDNKDVIADLEMKGMLLGLKEIDQSTLPRLVLSEPQKWLYASFSGNDISKEKSTFARSNYFSKKVNLLILNNND